MKNFGIFAQRKKMNMPEHLKKAAVYWILDRIEILKMQSNMRPNVEDLMFDFTLIKNHHDNPWMLRKVSNGILPASDKYSGEILSQIPLNEMGRIIEKTLEFLKCR